MARQATGLRTQRPFPGTPIGQTGAVSAAAAVTLYLATDRRWRSSEVLGDPPHRPAGGNATRDLLALDNPQRSLSSPARATTLYPVGPKTRTMMQSCAGFQIEEQN
jgi:hypothetical protein